MPRKLEPSRVCYGGGAQSRISGFEFILHLLPGERALRLGANRQKGRQYGEPDSVEVESNGHRSGILRIP